MTEMQPLPAHDRAQTSASTASIFQAGYFIVTGLWAIVHLRSFMVVTGPKRDTWLVRTFGALVAAVGAAMLASRKDGRAADRIGIATGVALAASEVIFVGRGRIRPIYLADAVAESVLAGMIARSWRSDPSSRSDRSSPGA